MTSRIYPAQRSHESAGNGRHTKNAKEKRTDRSKPMQPAKDPLKSKLTPNCSDTYVHFVTGK